MRYLIRLIVETDAPVEAVKHNFHEMADPNSSHEIAGPNDDFYMAQVSGVEVTPL